MPRLPEEVPAGAFTPESLDPQATALATPEAVESAEDQSKRAYAAEEILHRQQQREQKEKLFGWGLLISCIMLGWFVLGVYCFGTVATLAKETPLALIPLALTGLIPLGILIFLFKSVFNYGANDALDKKDLELFKEIAGIIKIVTK